MKTSAKWTWIAAGLVALVILAAPLPVEALHSGQAAPTERIFHIQASQFTYAPAVLHANPGDHVTIELEAMDVVHGLSIDGYNLETTADPGQTARLSFIAGKSGAYRFRCSITCGNMHPFMTGKLYVGQNSLLWRAAGLLFLLATVGIWKLWK